VVVGGGNTAVEEALYLANLAAKVTVVHRRGEFRAERILQERLFKHPNVEVLWHHAVEEVCGTQKPPSVTHLRLKDVRTGEIVERKTDGVFIAIGHQPATAIFEGQLAMRDGGYIDTKPGTTHTAIPGVYAAGDVTDDVYRQAITAAGMGCMAALDAEKFIAALEIGETPQQAAAE
jgi:thioredoxin reductase (NADPH)